MIVAKNPDFGFAYKTGVKNIRNIINIEIIFPISLMTPFIREVKNPNPRVNKNKGIINKGIDIIQIVGDIL